MAQVRATVQAGAAADRAWLLFACLVFFGAAATSLARESATFDEPVYVIAGLSQLTLRDFTLKEDAPPLVPQLAGLAPWALGLRIPGGRIPFDDSLAREYAYATRVLYGTADADRILFWSRLSLLIPFGLLLLGSAQAFARDLFGPAAGRVALWLAALCPNLLAHGGLVSADFPCAAAMLFASHRLARFLAAPGAARGLVAGLALGVALATKFTALLLLPAAGAVLLAWAWREPPGARLLRLAWAAAWIALPAAALVSLAWGWPPDPGRYARGLERLYRNARTDYPWFLAGRFHPGGVAWYYPAVLALKVSLPLLVLGAAGAVLALRRRASGPGLACLLLPPALLLAAASQDLVSAGLRRVLPVLPVLAVLGGAQAAHSRRARAAAVALLLAHALSSARAWPHYLPYFNEAALALRPPEAWLDDSNLDWGQDLKALPQALRRAGVERVVLWYFGMADPRAYGIDFELMAPERHARSLPGVYAVSQHHLIRHPEHWLARREPFARAGTSILLFRVED
jgi:hypothetical protein